MSDTSSDTNPVETSLRCIVLGAVYAAAVSFAIAFSPAVGLVSLHPVGDTGKLASAEIQSPRTTR